MSSRVTSKIRADELLFLRGLAPSRSRAQSLILAGVVFAGTERVDKPGKLLPSSIDISVKGKDHPFVGRGGAKLNAALDHFNVKVENKVCLDVGASTGGFTDCLLQRGATRVYALDVGYSQFHWTLRGDSRVVLFERANFRYFDMEKIDQPIDLAVADVSFISLVKILPRFREVRKMGEVLVLVKPQFELSPREVKKGVVTSPALREKAVRKVKEEAGRLGFRVGGCTPAPILGPKGNQEYFLHLLRA